MNCAQMKNSNSIRKNESGFTLIELFVTVSIVATLSALAITTYAVLKDKSYNAEQMQIFDSARKALEARDDNIHLVAGTYRRAWQPYNSDNWELLNTSDLKNIAPGVPRIIPNHIDLYIRENKCTTAQPTCQTQRIDSYNCKTGNWIQFYEQQNGIQSTYQNYADWVDDDC